MKHKMLTSTDFGLASCQATLFTPHAEVSSARLLSKLLPHWIHRFDGEPIVLPVPDGIPKQVPRVILQSKSEAWRCEIAAARIDLSWKPVVKKGHEVEFTHHRGFYGEVVSLLLDYAKTIDSPVGRLAAVINRYAAVAKPAPLLASHFCQHRWLESPLNRPMGFELHAYKSFLLAGRFHVNSWVRNKTGTSRMGDTEQPIVLVEQDFNTLAEDLNNRQFTADEIREFFEIVSKGLDETLALYYPSTA